MKTQSVGRRRLLTGARLGLGALMAAGSVWGVSAGIAAPWPTVQNEPVSSQVAVAAGDITLVCNGPFRVLGRDATDATQISAVTNPQLTTGGESSATAELEVPGLTGQDQLPGVLRGSAEGSTAPQLAAAESVSLGEEDVSGLAAAACREPRAESWLVGGAVETGANDIIILSNPGDVSATVTLAVYGMETPQEESIIVPAKMQLSLPLAAYAVDLPQPIIRVTAQGAPIRAALESTLTRVLDPAGIDLQDGVIAPAPVLRFLGVQVVTEPSETPEEATTILRLMATEQDTQVVVRVRAASSGALISETTVDLRAQAPAAVNLESLDPATYTVEVAADAGIVGAIWQSTGIAGGGDFAWMTPAPELAGDVLVAVPQGPQPRLHLQSMNTESTVRVQATDGSFEQEVAVPAEGAAELEVQAGKSYTLTPSAPVAAAVTLSESQALAGWPIWPSTGAQLPVTVYR